MEKTPGFTGGGEDGVELGLVERAGFLGKDVFAGAQRADGVIGLIGPARRTQRDEVDVGIGYQGLERIVDPDRRVVALRGCKLVARDACDGGELCLRVSDEVVVNLVAVEAVK